MRRTDVALLAAMFLLVSHWGGGLQAYLDPGTGSVALQLIIGSVVAALAAVRLYWDRLRSFVRRAPRPGTAAKES